MKVVDHFATGGLPQHVTPSWDLRTLWVTNDTGNSLTPIDPRTGRHGRPVPVTDPYNLYFTAGRAAGDSVAEAHRELDFREPHTMRLRTRCTYRAARASTTWTSRPTAGARSCRASSPGG